MTAPDPEADIPQAWMLQHGTQHPTVEHSVDYHDGDLGPIEYPAGSEQRRAMAEKGTVDCASARSAVLKPG